MAATGTVSYTGSDPRGTLLTAQAILEHGTFALDAYPDAPSDYRIFERNGRRFYAYPPGTPVAAVPAVALARLAGFDMARPEDDDAIQRILAAITVGITAVLASALAARWIPGPLATMFAAIFVFGTPVISTMGTALWSTNLTVVATLGALLLLSKSDTLSGRPARAIAAGALLGFAFWCRPPALLLAAVLIPWAFGHALTAPQRGSAMRNALALAAGAVASVALLVLISRLAYGTWLPEYYIGARLAASDRFTTALTGNLISPSRGLLIYAPAAALALGAVLLFPSRVLGVPFAIVALAWVCLHLVLVARFPYWWGGYGYGCRLLVDVLPGVLVFSCIAAAVVRGSSRRWRVAGLLALIGTGAAGIWINSAQGLFNTATARWNASPSIDAFPGYAFDWRLPQFLATEARLAERRRRHRDWLRPPLRADEDYTAASPRLRFVDWSSVEDAGGSVSRRSAGRAPSVLFLVSEETLRSAELMMLNLDVGAGRPAAGQVWFNGHPVATLATRGREPEHYAIGIPRELVRTLEYDVLQANIVEWRPARGREDAPLLFRALRVHAARR